MRVTDRRETIGERCQNKMGIIQAPFRPPKMLPRHTQVGRIWVTQARRECGPAIYRLPARTPQFILLSCRNRQLVNELPIEVDRKIYEITIYTGFTKEIALPSFIS